MLRDEFFFRTLRLIYRYSELREQANAHALTNQRWLAYWSIELLQNRDDKEFFTEYRKWPTLSLHCNIYVCSELEWNESETFYNDLETNKKTVVHCIHRSVTFAEDKSYLRKKKQKTNAINL